jgi:spore germination cell wall hydrolase CwlJ-like protein
LSIKFPARADTRALFNVVLLGATCGLALGGFYLAGGAARMADIHTHAQSLASAASSGFSEAALRAETAKMAPGALAVARRHDPLSGAAQADNENPAFTAKIAPGVQGDAAHAMLLRASFTSPAKRGALAGSRELDCLTQAVYYEARGESSEGQAAVAQVVMNRVRRPGFPKSVCGVVFQGAQDQACQFSFACDGSMRAAKEVIAWRRAQAVATRALSGFVLTAVGDATHFHTANLGQIWGAGLVQVAQIGAHTFYRATGHGAPAAHGAPVERTLYAEAKTTASAYGEGTGSSLILASAVAPVPLGPGSPLRGTTDVASAARATGVAASPAAAGPMATAKDAG